MTESDNKNSIADFSIHKMNFQKSTTSSPSKKDVNKRIWVSASVLSVLLAGSLTNIGLGERANQSSDSARGIASVEDNPRTKEYLQKESMLIRELAAKENLEATRGTMPSLMDQMIFGELQGMYSLQVENGSLIEIRKKADAVDVKPVQMNRFFALYKTFFPEFDRVEGDSPDQSGPGGHQTTYRLVKNSQIQAQVDVAYGPAGELLSLKVQK